MASPGNQHCVDCIGTLSFPVGYISVQPLGRPTGPPGCMPTCLEVLLILLHCRKRSVGCEFARRRCERCKARASAHRGKWGQLTPLEKWMKN